MFANLFASISRISPFLGCKDKLTWEDLSPLLVRFEFDLSSRLNLHCETSGSSSAYRRSTITRKTTAQPWACVVYLSSFAALRARGVECCVNNNSLMNAVVWAGTG